MANSTGTIGRSERTEHLTTVISGWGAVAFWILGFHRWIVLWTFDGWTRGLLILALGLTITWLWGHWGTLLARLRGWTRSGGLNTTLIAIGVVVSLVIVNNLVRRRLPLRYDMTKNKRFSLAPRSQQIVKSLTDPLQVTVFVPTDSRESGRIHDLFRQYQDANPKIAVTYANPVTDQKAVLQKQPKLSFDYLDAVMEYQGRRQDVSTFTEKDVTSAILKLTRTTPRKIAFLKGHGEITPDASSNDPRTSIRTEVEDLKNLGWPVETLDLYGKNAKAPDADTTALVVINGPKQALAPEEEKRLGEYLNKGGRLLVLLSRDGNPMTKFLAGWGLKTANDLVIGAAQSSLLILADAASGSTGDVINVAKEGHVVFGPCRSVTAISPAPNGYTVRELLTSGQGSQVVDGYAPGKPITLKGARPGPIGIAAVSEKNTGLGGNAKKAQVMVVGDNGWITDQWMMLPQFSNHGMVNAMVNSLGEEEALVDIPPKDENTEQAFLTPDQGRLIDLLHFADFPLLALALAIGVYLKRR